MSGNKGFAIGGVLVLVMLLAVGSMIGTDPKSDLILVSDAVVTSESGERFIRGAVQNRAQEAYSNVEMVFDLLDDGGSNVGQVRIAISAIAPGDSWSFTEAIAAEHAVTFKVKRASGSKVSS